MTQCCAPELDTNLSKLTVVSKGSTEEKFLGCISDDITNDHKQIRTILQDERNLYF